MLQEPWNTLLFLVAIPLIQQGLKLLADRYGFTLGKLANQALSLVLSIIFLLLSGEIAGFDIPVWGGDLVEFIGDLIAFFGVAWASVVALYELVWDRLFKIAKLATADKY